MIDYDIDGEIYLSILDKRTPAAQIYDIVSEFPERTLAHIYARDGAYISLYMIKGMLYVHNMFGPAINNNGLIEFWMNGVYMPLNVWLYQNTVIDDREKVKIRLKYEERYNLWNDLN